MAKWIFEPAHTSAEFSARHMMIANVRGHFKDVHGWLVFDPADLSNASTEVTIDARKLWTGDQVRDDHLRSADFLDVNRYPEIKFRSNQVTLLSETEYQVAGDLTIRDITRPATLDVRYLGRWQAPPPPDDPGKGPSTRAGFEATTKINRQDFGVSWNVSVGKNGIVVGNTVTITIDVEAVLQNEEP